VGDDAPQNHSCGVEVKHEVQMKCNWKCKTREYFSSFSYELGEEQGQREQREKEHRARLVELGQGECHELPVHRLL